MEMFLFDLGRSLNLLFASLLWFKLLRLSTQIAQLAYFVFLNNIYKKGHFTYWKCDIRDGVLKNIKNSYRTAHPIRTHAWTHLHKKIHTAADPCSAI